MYVQPVTYIYENTYTYDFIGGKGITYYDLSMRGSSSLLNFHIHNKTADPGS